MVNYNLNNKVALITGANNPLGIGAAVARALAKEGAKVFITYYRISPDYAKSLIMEYGMSYEETKTNPKPGMPYYHFLHTKDAQEVLATIRNEGGIAEA